MNRKNPFLTLILVFVLTSSVCQNSLSNLENIGGELPIDSALVFGKGFISTDDFEFSITFSPNMDELFFTRRAAEQDNIIYHSELKNNQWTAPDVVFFTPKKGWDFEPHIHPNGKALFFGSTRPLPDSTKSTGLYQWKSEKTHEGWSIPKPLGGAFLKRNISMYLTASLKDNFFFTSGEKGEKPEDWGIYTSSPEGESYKEVSRMSENINGKGKWIAHSFIAPDETYLIFDFKDPKGYGNADIYISLKTKDGWSKPYNLGPKINTEATEMCASVSPDGKYLFFHRGDKDRGNIYWIAFEPLLKSIKDKRSKKQENNLDVEFKKEESQFRAEEKELALAIIHRSEKKVRELLPDLPSGIKLQLELVDWDLDLVGGVTGRAETNSPPLVLIQVSIQYPGGVESALESGLASTLYHELHHLSLGWAIQDNNFLPDIKTATIIEGLAEVFSEEFTGVSFEENQMPEGVNPADWVREIIALPKNADYQTWMFQHPDGRTSIGYKTGNYLVKRAISRSGKNILELSNLPVEEIYRLAGY
jgi:hypothetical protein